MQSSKEFKQYVSKLRYVEAVEIDSVWQEFLRKEQGYTSVNIGDFYVKQCDGNYIVLTKERFYRLFEDINNLLAPARQTVDDLIKSISCSGEQFEKDK